MDVPRIPYKRILLRVLTFEKLILEGMGGEPKSVIDFPAQVWTCTKTYSLVLQCIERYCFGLHPDIQIDVSRLKKQVDKNFRLLPMMFPLDTWRIQVLCLMQLTSGFEADVNWCYSKSIWTRIMKEAEWRWTCADKPTRDMTEEQRLALENTLNYYDCIRRVAGQQAVKESHGVEETFETWRRGDVWRMLWQAFTFSHLAAILYPGTFSVDYKDIKFLLEIRQELSHWVWEPCVLLTWGKELCAVMARDVANFDPRMSSALSEVVGLLTKKEDVYGDLLEGLPDQATYCPTRAEVLNWRRSEMHKFMMWVVSEEHGRRSRRGQEDVSLLEVAFNIFMAELKTLEDEESTLPWVLGEELALCSVNSIGTRYKLDFLDSWDMKMCLVPPARRSKLWELLDDEMVARFEKNSGLSMREAIGEDLE